MKVLEFYSGIGGMHYALQMTGVSYEVIAAFEINTTANAVYKHNFPGTPLMQKNIEGLTKKDLQTKFQADVWTMSPPCQPYTRQGKQEASSDPRAKSFLNLLNILSEMEEPPMHILMENVKGFEVSDTRDLFVDVLKARGYAYQELLLSPNDFGIPNSRLRYYLIAKRAGQFVFQATEKPWCCCYEKFENQFALYHTIKNCTITQCLCEHASNRISKACELQEFLDDETEVSTFSLGQDILLRFYSILDIVKPHSNHSCCFTKAYGKYVEGTGSVLTTVSEEQFTEVNQKLQSVANDQEKLQLLSTLDLRYFSPSEVSKLMCFPQVFTFPEETTLKQKYRLLGNSVNVLVVSVVMGWMFA